MVEKGEKKKNALIHGDAAISCTRKADGSEDAKLLSVVVFCLAAFVRTSGTSAGSAALLTTLRYWMELLMLKKSSLFQLSNKIWCVCTKLLCVLMVSKVLSLFFLYIYMRAFLGHKYKAGFY